MTKSRTSSFIKVMLFLSAIVGLVAGMYLNNRPDSIRDIPFVFVYQNSMSIYFEPIIYILVFIEVIKIRRIMDAIEVRNKTDFVLDKLIQLVVSEWAIFWICALVPYWLLNLKTSFKFGTPTLGILILGLNMVTMLLGMLLLLSAYKLPYPYLILLLVLAITGGYHYGIELNCFLPHYSPIFDPTYRAIHQIYF